MTETIDFVLRAIGGSVALFCLFESTRRIGAYGFHRTAVLMFVASLAACVFAGGSAYQEYKALNAATVTAQRDPAAKPVARRPASAEKKEQAAQVLARQAFTESGVVASYVDRNGETRSFAPTPTDVKNRERVVAFYSRAEFSAKSSLAEAALWLIGGVVAVIMGLFMSLAKPPAPKSPEEAALAAEPPLHR